MQPALDGASVDLAFGECDIGVGTAVRDREDSLVRADDGDQEQQHHPGGTTASVSRTGCVRGLCVRGWGIPGRCGTARRCGGGARPLQRRHRHGRGRPSGGEIRLLARHHGERVILSVEDNGEGIPYSQQARIFEPFVQIGRRRGGAGLGLALCKEIAQLHGGRIGVHSRIGHGTIFYIALPI